jgi:hypothetical protein
MVLDAAPNGATGASRSRPASSSRWCRLRDVPIITFVNKRDRESRDPEKSGERLGQVRRTCDRLTRRVAGELAAKANEARACTLFCSEYP